VDAANPGEVGSPMPGRVIVLHVAEGAEVAEGDPMLTLEAMKMETIVRAPVAGIVQQLHADVGASVQAEDLLIVVDVK
jgi:biotin carboxyl carrier protein